MTIRIIQGGKGSLAGVLAGTKHVFDYVGSARVHFSILAQKHFSELGLRPFAWWANDSFTS
jgi:hypothetical protein